MIKLILLIIIASVNFEAALFLVILWGIIKLLTPKQKIVIKLD